jgi:hypothetical protein
VYVVDSVSSVNGEDHPRSRPGPAANVCLGKPKAELLSVHICSELSTNCLRLLFDRYWTMSGYLANRLKPASISGQARSSNRRSFVNKTRNLE